MKLTNRTYGVEIEFKTASGCRPSSLEADAERRTIATALRTAGVSAQVESYNHDTKTWWKLVSDGSAGHELVSPILKGEEGFREIRKVCKVLVSLGYKVDKNCGFHVHHGARDLTTDNIKAVFALAIKWETVIDKLVAPSRVGNGYCCSNNPSRSYTFEGTKSALNLLKNTADVRRYGSCGHDRYLKVNYTAFLRQGTIEFRQHQGTLDADKMIWWIILTQNFITKSVECGASYTVSRTGICFKRFRDMLGSTGVALENNAYVKAAAKMTVDRWHEFSSIGLYDSTLAVI